MGNKIYSRDSVAPWNSFMLPSVQSGLEGWFDCAVEARRGAFNRAMGKQQAQVVGAPVAYATHLRMSLNTGYIQTQIPETVEQTLFTLGRAVGPFPDAANAVIFAGTYLGPVNPATLPPGVTTSNSYGASIYADNNGNISYAASRDNGAGGMTSAGASISSGAVASTNWAIRVMRVAAGQTNGFDKTGNVQVSSSVPRSRITSMSPFRLGAPSGSTTNSGTVDLSQTIIYSRALSDDEINTVVGYMRNRANRLGISA